MSRAPSRDRDVTTLSGAAHEKRVPFSILDVEQSVAAYQGGGLVLLRPDQHVARRGDRIPADPVAFIDRIRSAAKRALRTGAE